MAKKKQIGYQPIDQAYTRDIDAWFIILMLIVLFPIGIWLMWTRTPWKKWVKGTVTVVVLALFLSNAIQVTLDLSEARNAAETTASEVQTTVAV